MTAFELMHDPIAESCIAGMAVYDPANVAPRTSHFLSRRDFFNTDHGLVYEACCNAYHAGHAIDPREERYNDLGRAIKNTPYFTQVQQACKHIEWIYDDSARQHFLRNNAPPHSGHCIYYAERIRDMAISRRACVTMAESMQALQASPDDPGTTIDLLTARCSQMRQGMAGRGPKEAWEAFQEVIADAETRTRHEGPSKLFSGLPSADQAGLIFGEGELSVLAARPGVGKTAFAAQIAMHHACKMRGVMIASLEMSHKELAARILNGKARMGSTMRTATKIDDSTVQELRNARDELGRIPLWLWSPGRVSAAQIAAEASLCHAVQGLRLLIVDYIGLVKYEGTQRERYMQVGEVVKQLRDIGQKLQIPVLALAQLSRAAESEEPKLSHLRESGDIEQDADVVAFLHKESPTKTHLIVGKNRHGNSGRCELLWVPEETTFVDPVDFKRETDFDHWNNG